MEEQTDSYLQQFLSLNFKSKQDFIREYKRYDESSGRGIYLQLLTKLTKAITEGNVASFYQLSTLIDYIGNVKSQETLGDYYNNTTNPIRSTNIVILACKHNNVEILKSIFSNNRILDNVSINVGNAAIVPNDKDETCHNAFYYAIRSGNTKLLDALINKWPDNYFAVHSEELDEVLSKGYEELRLKNVLLSDEIEMYVENKLINLRFFSNSAVQVRTAKDDLSNIKERAKLVLANIELLRAEYLEEKETDDKFIFISKFIAQNIHVLKRQLKSTYARLPWEEIEFCLVCFIAGHVKRQAINLFYRSTLNQSSVLNHLEHFANKLKDEIDIIEDVGMDKLSDLPKLTREKVVAEIINNCPQFNELYKDHQQIRDIHSLEKINNYIKLALSGDPRESEGKLIIARALQVMGECLKNTLESPKLSNTTGELLLLTLAKNTRKIIGDLRNSLSHAYALSKRTEIENNKDVNFFIGIQNDIKKVGVVITDIIYNNKIKMIRILLKKIVDSNLDEVKGIATVLSTFELDTIITEKFELIEHKNLIKLIKELSDNIPDKTYYEMEMFGQMNRIISSAGDRSDDIRTDYMKEYVFLKSTCLGLSEIMIDHNVIRGFKFRANQILQNVTTKIESRTLKKIAKFSLKILDSAEPRIQSDVSLDQIKRLVWEIFFIAEFRTGDIKYIAELSGKLKEKAAFIPLYKQKKTTNLKADHYTNQMALKIAELKDILSNKLTILNSNENLSSYKKDKKLQAAVEMLVLDILAILGRNNNLANNQLFLDDNSPLLNGKCLRNHLAHDNALVDILFSDPSITIILNAKQVSEENIMENKKQLGRLVNDDPGKLEEKHNQGLAHITLQDNMFRALEEGHLESFKDCLRKGADINARNINSWTTLHFAAKGPSLKAVKLIIDQNLNPNVVDTKGQSPLHVAAKNGRGNIVNFFLKEAGLYVDCLDYMGKTALHVAAQRGYRDTVEVLLENKANTASKDLSGMLPFHHAIRNNHLDIAKVLLAKDANVDIDETMGGFTPLHEAAEFGHVELVNFLLKNKADINARNDGDWRPLHAAAFNGHLEVVNALILNGADVKARVVDGSTPLHHAAENGHDKVVTNLLDCGANVNAADKSDNSTALHSAAKDGHLGSVKILLKNKANASAETVAGATPLHLAVQGNHLEIVTVLLEHGVNIQSKDKSRATPLHCAVESGHKEVVELLINAGAEVNARCYDDLTPLHVATLEGYQGIAGLLVKNEARVEAQDIKGNTPLHGAAINGSVDVIELLLNSNGEVQPRNDEGMTPLHLAAVKGHLEAIVLLIKNEADVNARTIHGDAPLHLAVVGGYKDVITLLIENKAQLDARALQIAVEAGHKDIVEILISNGANVNVGNSEQTPLLTAIKCNHKEIAQVLIAKGTNVNTEGIAPLELAVFLGFRQIAEMLLKNKANANIRDPDNSTPLHVAAKNGYTNIVIALIKSGADVDAVTTNNVTALYLAAAEGYEEVVEILLTNRASINVITTGGTPLHIAAGYGHYRVVKVLLNQRVNINVKDYKNRTPLELAIARGHLQIVQMLLRHHKEDMNLKGNRNSWTLLHSASQQSYLEMVKYLVEEEGYDINAKNASGSKSIHIAAREGHRDTVEFFLSKGLSINEPDAANRALLHYAAMKGQLEVVSYLLTEGADVNAQDATGATPMHYAAKFGHKDVIIVLLKNCAFYNPVDKLFRRPLAEARDANVINLLESIDKLYKAVKSNNSSEVERCIEKGAFVNAKNADGVTPLHYAAWKGYDAVVNVLLQNKADPNAAMNDGTTSLHYAAKFSRLKVVMALLSNGAVYNSVSDSGQLPLDLAVDKDITGLFHLVSESFRNIKNDSSEVINVLNRIKDVATIKAIMGARNKESETLVVAAMHNNFSKLEELKQIAQGDVSFQIAIALEHSRLGDHQKALNIFENAFERRKQILSPTNPGTLDIQMHIAKALYAQGLYEESLYTFEDVFHKQAQELGLNNKYTLSTRAKIAVVLHKQGKNEEAFNIFQEVHKKQTEILGSDDSDTLDTLFNMAAVLETQGKYEEALDINMAAYQNSRETSGAYDPGTVRAQNNIAMVLASQGKLEEALQMYKEVSEKKKLVFGINHADTLRTLHNIAAVLLRQNKYHDALQTLHEVLDIQKNVLGPNHPDTLNTQYNVANALFTQGKCIGALKAYNKCLYKMKAVFGSSHSSVLNILEKLNMIKMIFGIRGIEESDILQFLQKEINTAASKGDTQTVQRLIEDGVDVNDKDIDGRTPLHYAISSRWIGIVNILLTAGADVTRVTNKGNTPLHTAASKGYSEIVDVLLQHVDRDKLNDFVNAKTFAGGTTSLHVAVKSGYLAIVKSLLKHGAVHDIKDKQSKIPLDVCRDQNIADLLKLTLKLFKEAINGSAEIVSQLKALKPDEFLAVTNARNNEGNTLLQVVAINKHSDVASKLLEHFDVDLERVWDLVHSFGLSYS